MTPPAYILNWKNRELERLIALGLRLDFPAVFGNDHPVDCEIGIGNGSFLAPLAAAHPDRNVVGIELVGEYARKADRKLVTAGLSNVRLMVGDAKLLVWKLFPEESLDHVYVNYPDPWFKKRHVKRRLINAVTLRMLARSMRATVTVATDDAEYRDWVLESAGLAACFENVFDDGYASELPGYFETKYEKKWKSMGKPVYYLRFRKTAHPDLDASEYIETQNLRFPLEQITARHSSTTAAVTTPEAAGSFS